MSIFPFPTPSKKSSSKRNDFVPTQHLLFARFLSLIYFMLYIHSHYSFFLSGSIDIAIFNKNHVFQILNQLPWLLFNFTGKSRRSNQSHKISNAWEAEFLTSKSESYTIDDKCFFTWSFTLPNFTPMSLSAFTHASLTFGTPSLDAWKIKPRPFSRYWSFA